MKRQAALVFGSFDPLHKGHAFVFSEAKKLADAVIVVVTRDEVIKKQKQRDPHQNESERLHAVLQEDNVDKAILGDEDPQSYHTLRSLDFDILVLGYDQEPSDEEVKRILMDVGKRSVKVIRLPPYQPEKFKSSLLRLPVL